jgi:hypothetical protein
MHPIHLPTDSAPQVSKLKGYICRHDYTKMKSRMHLKDMTHQAKVKKRQRFINPEESLQVKNLMKRLSREPRATREQVE